MALAKISTGGVKADAASQAKITDEAVDEARLQERIPVVVLHFH